MAPTAAMHRDLYAAIAVVEPRSGRDQKLLNAFFVDWARLPDCCNFLRTYGWVLGPFRDSRMRVLHDASNKPWTFRKQVMAVMVLEPFDRL